MNGNDWVERLEILSQIYTFTKEEESIILSGDILGIDRILEIKTTTFPKVGKQNE